MSWRGMTWLKIIVVLVLIFVVGSPRLARSSGFSNTTASFTQHSIDTALTPFLYTHPIWMAIMISILSLLNVLSRNQLLLSHRIAHRLPPY